MKNSVFTVVLSLLVILCLSHAFRREPPHRRRRQHLTLRSSSQPSPIWIARDVSLSFNACSHEEEKPSFGAEESVSNSRRNIVKAIVSSGLVKAELCSHEAVADDRQVEQGNSMPSMINKRKPYAPIEYLLPATRVQIFIDQAVATAQSLVDTQKKGGPSNKETEKQLISKLSSLLLEPRQFMSREESTTAKNYLEQDTWGDWTRARQEDSQRQFGIDVDPITALNESFEQWGERRQFKRLRKQQLALEKGNAMRAAFNAYTDNLVFGENYILTAGKEDKSRLIRSYNQLPDVTSVIRSDLDLRDLHRNQVLTNMDDARAELKFQLKSSSEVVFDGTELLALLSQAQSSCSAWFGFVPESDAKDALQQVVSE